MKILVIGTLDTKGEETGYLCDCLTRLGADVLIMDPGVLGEPRIPADITRQEIALAGGEELESLLQRKDKAHAQQVMITGLVKLVLQRYHEEGFDGIVAVGGAQGTAMATAAMRALPVGIPKVMLSTVACGMATFGPYVGTKDITMIHSVADISGLNRITYRLLAQAAGAVTGMAAAASAERMDYLHKPAARELIAITQAGITTPGVMAVKGMLEADGFEVIAFHCNGIGGKAMEEMILDGVIQGVIDFSPHEITDFLYGGYMPALPDRLTAAGVMGIPQIVAPGGTDIRLYGVGSDVPVELRERQCVQHTPIHTHVRTSVAEMEGVAQFIAARLNEGRGPRAAVVPLRGFSMLNRDGFALFDAAANQAFVETLRKELSRDVRLVEVDAHINDIEFARAAYQLFLELRSQARKIQP